MSIDRTRRMRRWPLVLLGVVIAAGLWLRVPIHGFAVTGASYGARVACSCHYIGGRTLSDCRKDFESGMEPVMLSANETEKSVTATFPLLARQTARVVEGEGCRLDPWQR